MCRMVRDDNENILSNFGVRVIRLIELFDVKTKGVDIYFELELLFENGASKIVRVSSSTIEKVSWSQLDVRCRFMPNVSQTKAKKYLLDTIYREAEKASKQIIYLIKETGYFELEGEIGFFTGGEIIASSKGKIKELTVEIEPAKNQLEVDDELSEQKAIRDMLDFLELSPQAANIILVHKLTYLMYHAYLEAGITPRVCVYLYGLTGTQKTTIASYLTQIYNRSDGVKNPVRLNSSEAAAKQLLVDAPYDTIVLDDLFPAESKQDCREQEKILLEVTRWVGDGIVPLRKKGNRVEKSSICSGAVFTGEYLIGRGSNAGRLLPVEMQKPDEKELKYFQDKPLGLSTFFYYYIFWYLDNYAEIVDYIKEWDREYQKYDLRINPRLKETHRLFNITYTLLMHFAFEKGVVTKNDGINLHQKFLKLITRLVKEQHQRVDSPVAMSSDTDNYLDKIRNLYQDKKIIIANNTSQFDKKKHDGVVHRNCLYFRGDKLQRCFPHVSMDEIVAVLKSQDVLECGKVSNTKQINSLKGMRFYVIPLKYLESHM